MHTVWGVPASAFHNREARERYLKLNLTKVQATKLRNACNRMLLETEMTWRLFDVYKLDPVSTQDCVAYHGVGTKVDVVVRDRNGHLRVLEMKKYVRARLRIRRES